MTRRIVLYLVRRRLKLKLFEPFRFEGQKASTVYYFTRSSIVKVYRGGTKAPSGVSLNWLINPECGIERVTGESLIPYKLSREDLR